MLFGRGNVWVRIRRVLKSIRYGGKVERFIEQMTEGLSGVWFGRNKDKGVLLLKGGIVDSEGE